MNALEKFEKKKWPEDIQHDIERFAGHDGEYTEKDYGYWFRAGFLAREYSSHDGWLLSARMTSTLTGTGKLRLR